MKWEKDFPGGQAAIPTQQGAWIDPWSEELDPHATSKELYMQ